MYTFEYTAKPPISSPFSSSTKRSEALRGKGGGLFQCHPSRSALQSADVKYLCTLLPTSCTSQRDGLRITYGISDFESCRNFIGTVIPFSVDRRIKRTLQKMCVFRWKFTLFENPTCNEIIIDCNTIVNSKPHRRCSFVIREHFICLDSGMKSEAKCGNDAQIGNDPFSLL